MLARRAERARTACPTGLAGNVAWLVVGETLSDMMGRPRRARGRRRVGARQLGLDATRPIVVGAARADRWPTAWPEPTRTTAWPPRLPPGFGAAAQSARARAGRRPAPFLDVACAERPCALSRLTRTTAWPARAPPGAAAQLGEGRSSAAGIAAEEAHAGSWYAGSYRNPRLSFATDGSSRDGPISVKSECGGECRHDEARHTINEAVVQV